MENGNRPNSPNLVALTVGDASDAELVQQAKRCIADFGPLYLRYRDRVYRYCACRLDAGAEAEDATSAVFVKALAGLRNFDDGGTSFRPWLFRIAHNEVTDRHKRRAVRPETSLTTAMDFPDPTSSPEAEAETADALNRLRILLRTLSPRERGVLELRLSDLSTEEIAAVLGISVGSVWTAQSRALAHVRDAMGIASGSATTHV
jgi:RNA polymerase sigma-70 factor, ECF subfamily